MVSGSASPSERPTGTKSPPTWPSIANRAGRAYLAGIAPTANCAPRSVPTICAITAPGPRIGDRNGSEQMKQITSIPGSDPARGAIVLAITLPSPLALMIPRMVDVNAMNGRMFLMTMSIVSRPAWKNLLTTAPTPLPRRTTNPCFFPSLAAAISALASSFVLGPLSATAAAAAGAAATSGASPRTSIFDSLTPET